MLEKPAIPDQHILTCLQVEYGLESAQVTFLPIGADINTAVYRVDAANGTPYFLKLRKGSFDPITVEVPLLLKTQGSGANCGANGGAVSAATIAPLETRAGRLWGSLEPYTLILYPFVEGRDGYQVALSDRQWIDFGAVLRGVHETQVPGSLATRIPRETFSAQYRDQARLYLAQAQMNRFDEPVAARLAAFMRARRDTIAHMLARCDQLARALQKRDLQARALEFVLCHADVHPGNLLLTGQGALYLVDWDNPIFAPKERDLMSIGAGMGSDLGQREALFYQGYGPAKIDPMALAYYRYERVIADIAAFCDQLLASSAGGADREQSYEYFISNFRPGSVIEVAFHTDRYCMR